MSRQRGTGSSRRGAAIPLLAGAVVLLIGAMALAALWAGDRGDWRGGRNRQVNATTQLDANNSPSVVRNPLRRANLAVTHRVDRPAFSARLHWSDDDGSSWHATELPLPRGLDRPYAPDAAFGPDGTLYVSYVNLIGNGNVPDTLWVSRSSDGGRSLSDPVRVTQMLPFQARLAVGPDSTVYATWLQARSVGLFKMPELPNPIVVATSTDGGRTFGAPVQASDGDRPRVAAPTPVVDARGRLLVLYEDFRSDRRDFEFLEGPPAEEPFALVLTESSDGGRTFSAGIEVEPAVVATRRFLVFLPELPSIAVGPGDAVVVAWADGRHGDEDVFLRRSDDGGRTWGPAVRVNDNRMGDGTAQYLPRIGVAPSGRLDVLFLDRRRDAGDVMTDAYLATSEDGGRTFTNRRLSTTSFDSGVGPFIDATFPVDFGSRLGIVSSDDGALAVWTDSRSGTEGTGRQDIMAARFSRSDPGPLRWTAVAALAALGSLCGWAAARRRVTGAEVGGAPAGRPAGGDGEASTLAPS